MLYKDEILEVLKKHDIEDEKLASALEELFKLSYQESKEQYSKDLMSDLRRKGIRF